MKGRSKKSKPGTSKATSGAVSSTALPAGPSPSDSPGLVQQDLFGAPASPASPSARPAKGKGKRTKDTSGLCSFGSSASASLQQSLANRLLRMMDTDGSPEYEMTWSRRAMQSGAPICRLHARARRTFGKGCFGWPSPCVRDSGGPHLETTLDRLRKTGNRHSRLVNEVRLVGWPSPTVGDSANACNRTATRNEGSQHHDGLTLVDAMSLAGWATPTAQEKVRSQEFLEGRELNALEALAGWSTPRGTDGDKGIRTSEGAMAEFARKGTGADLPTMASLAGWASPTLQDAHNTAGPSQMERNSLSLNAQVTLAGWTTPQASEPESPERPSRAETGRTTEYLGRQAQSVITGCPTPQASWAAAGATSRSGDRKDEYLIGGLVRGMTSDSSPAATGRRGVLNPAMSRWLMGFPQGMIPGWDSCSPGWSSWDTVQRLLAEFCGRQGATESADCEDMAMPS